MSRRPEKVIRVPDLAVPPSRVMMSKLKPSSRHEIGCLLKRKLLTYLLLAASTLAEEMVNKGYMGRVSTTYLGKLHAVLPSKLTRTSHYKTRHTPRTIVTEHVSSIMVLLEVDINSSVQQLTAILGKAQLRW
ncbi:hypothetical protein ARMGADRAFT_1030508 [Armillaria gallica]|uniref:Uncharacterized protein n=1 Tax=Armillaria gallica TaxID=47427 RepID=A0A2H3DCW5_ARMGA|nr:hypothetical protein ARMGADRAFT_1030508 [Armillaria gallica]